MRGLKPPSAPRRAAREVERRERALRRSRASTARAPLDDDRRRERLRFDPAGASAESMRPSLRSSRR